MMYNMNGTTGLAPWMSVNAEYDCGRVAQNITGAKSASASVTEDKIHGEKVFYIYEKNMKTGSSSWVYMLLQAEGDLEEIPCMTSTSLNALTVDTHALGTRDGLIACHTRRMSVPRRVHNVRFIASFNLEKDLVLSAYMQRKNLTIDKVDFNGTDYQHHKNTFRVLWSLDYMGYSNSYDGAFQDEKWCPISQHVQDLVNVAVEDTYLPISHDLPCISKLLLKEMVGLDVLDEVTVNVRGDGTKMPWEMDLSCVDIALSQGFTFKLLHLYDGTNLSLVEDWRGEARRVEETCVSRRAKTNV
jgi:hypothetical protein